MLKKIILCLALINVSCGPNEIVKAGGKNVTKYDEPVYNDVPPEIRPHLSEFIEFCKSSTPSNRDTCSKNMETFYGISFADHPIQKGKPEVVGICQFYEYAGKVIARKITISKSMVDSTSLRFKSLIWHELGHCLLDLNHIPTTNRIHIMNPVLINEIELGRQWSRLVNAFFSYQIKF